MLEIKIPLYQVNNQFSVNNVNLKIKSGSIFALIGKSGSGKSTIAKIVSGDTISPTSNIYINKLSLTTNNERLIREFESIGYVPQNLHLMPHHSVNEFLEMLFQRNSKTEAKRLIETYVKDFNLNKIINSKISSLSGGERQKLALIQAISKPIKALVLDEPFSQLDTLQKQDICTIIQKIIKKLNIPCLMISHDIIDVIRLSDQLGVMHKGKLLFKGDWQKFYTSKQTQLVTLRKGMEDYLNQTINTIEGLKKLIASVHS